MVIAEGQRQQNINQQENAASVLCCQIRKSPDISQPDRCSAADRTYPSLPEKLLLFVMFHFQSLSFFVKYVFTIPYFHQKGFRNFRRIFMHLCRFLNDALLTICSLLQIFSYINFNILITRSREGSDAIYVTFLTLTMNFNPRSREGTTICAETTGCK